MDFLRTSLVVTLLISFFLNTALPISYASTMPWMPEAGVMVHPSNAFIPAHLKGLLIDVKNPFKFDFVINRGQENLSPEQKQLEYKKLVKYFLAALAVPDKDQWVNLSPYEKDRVLPDNFGKTEMGRDLLAQDYLLKQISSSLTNPQESLGQEFWKKVYAQAFATYGSTDIPTDTFNKVWITPGKAVVYEKNNAVYVVEQHLKVMLDTDYVAMNANEGDPTGRPYNAIAGQDDRRGAPVGRPNEISKQILREIIIPAIEKEVNEGQSFARLRQIYSGMILSAWYKHELKNSILYKIYGDQSKLKGIDQDPKINQEIYDQYVEAYKKGVYNLIKEDVDPKTNEVVPRKYFSGGAEGISADYFNDTAMVSRVGSAPMDFDGNNDMAQVILLKDQAFDAAQMPARRVITISASDFIKRASDPHRQGTPLESLFRITQSASETGLPAESRVHSSLAYDVLRRYEEYFGKLLKHKGLNSPIYWIAFLKMVRPLLTYTVSALNPDAYILHLGISSMAGYLTDEAIRMKQHVAIEALHTPGIRRLGVAEEFGGLFLVNNLKRALANIKARIVRLKKNPNYYQSDLLALEELQRRIEGDAEHPKENSYLLRIDVSTLKAWQENPRGFEDALRQEAARIKKETGDLFQSPGELSPVVLRTEIKSKRHIFDNLVQQRYPQWSGEVSVKSRLDRIFDDEIVPFLLKKVTRLSQVSKALETTAYDIKIEDYKYEGVLPGSYFTEMKTAWRVFFLPSVNGLHDELTAMETAMYAEALKKIDAAQMIESEDAGNLQVEIDRQKDYFLDILEKNGHRGIDRLAIQGRVEDLYAGEINDLLRKYAVGKQDVYPLLVLMAKHVSIISKNIIQKIPHDFVQRTHGWEVGFNAASAEEEIVKARQNMKSGEDGAQSSLQRFMKVAVPVLVLGLSSGYLVWKNYVDGVGRLWGSSVSKQEIAAAENAYGLKDEGVLLAIAERVVNQRREATINHAGPAFVFTRVAEAFANLRLNEISRNPDNRMGGQLPQYWKDQLSKEVANARASKNVGPLIVLMDQLSRELKSERSVLAEYGEEIRYFAYMVPVVFKGGMGQDSVLVQNALKNFGGKEIKPEEEILENAEKVLHDIVHGILYQQPEYRQHVDRKKSLERLVEEKIQPLSDKSNLLMDAINLMISYRENESNSLIVSKVLDEDAFRYTAAASGMSADAKVRKINAISNELKQALLKLEHDSIFNSLTGDSRIIWQELGANESLTGGVGDIYLSRMFNVAMNFADGHGQEVKEKFMPLYYKIQQLVRAVKAEQEKEADWIVVKINNYLKDQISNIEHKAVDQAAKIEAENAKGGIDLNAENLDLVIKRDGNGVPLPVGEQDLENVHLDGLVPVIVDIKPAANLAALWQ